MLSSLVITFLPSSKRLLISCLQSPSAVILEPPQKSVIREFQMAVIVVLDPHPSNRASSYLIIPVQKTKIMASSPITSWQIDRETMERVTDFIFLGSKITADGDFSHEIKRRLLLRRKAMTTLDSLLKSRDITLPTKVPLVKAMVFPVVKYGCESWTIKKAECRITDAFEL